MLICSKWMFYFCPGLSLRKMQLKDVEEPNLSTNFLLKKEDDLGPDLSKEVP